MDNYTTVQKLLHRTVLSSRFMREVTFDFEKLLFHKKSIFLPDNHIFIAGLARSGSTTILNAIAECNEFASLSYEDMPFVLAPNFWNSIAPKKHHQAARERAHGDGVDVSTKSPEAFEEVFWKTFADHDDVEDAFRAFINLIVTRYGKTRYLSKNNQNIRRLDRVHKIFPNSNKLVPFRLPAQQAFSLFSQHQKFKTLQQEDPFTRDYMNWIGHSEFGLDYRPIVSCNLTYQDDDAPDHWLEQWFLTYESAIDLFKLSDHLFPVCYEHLCASDDVWHAIQRRLEISHDNDSPFVLKNVPPPVEFDANLLGRCMQLYDELAKVASNRLSRT